MTTEGTKDTSRRNSSGEERGISFPTSLKFNNYYGKRKNNYPPIYGGLTVEEAGDRQSEIVKFLVEFSESVTDANASEKVSELAPFLLPDLLTRHILKPLMKRLSSALKNK